MGNFMNWEHTQVGSSYARQAGEAGSGQASRSAQLLEQGKMPQEGWHDRLLHLWLRFGICS